MPSVQSLRFGTVIAVFVAAQSVQALAANCGNGVGNGNGNPHCPTVSAPAPLLGTGLLGAVVLIAGCLAATRRKP